jgi:hypothetical protein
MKVVLHVTQNGSSFGRDDSVTFIETFDCVHQAHVQDDFIEDWLAATHKSSIATLWNNGQSLVVTIFKNSRNFLVGLRLEHELTLPLELLSPILIAARKVICIRDDLIFLEDRIEETDIFVSQCCKTTTPLHIHRSSKCSSS